MDKSEALETIDDVNKFCVEGLYENMSWDGVAKRFEKHGAGIIVASNAREA